MGLISMGIGMAISSARYRKRRREAEARRSRTSSCDPTGLLLGAVAVGAVATTVYGLKKAADAGDALKPVNEQISREITKTHARTWATIGFFGTAFYHAGTRPVPTANPSLSEIATVVAITVLGYLVGWLIGRWAGTSNEDDSVCETEMLLINGDERVTHVTQDTVDRDRAVM